MPWSAQLISPIKTISSLAQKIAPSGAGTPVAAIAAGAKNAVAKTVGDAAPILGDAPRVIPPASPVQTVNPTASQRSDAEPLPTMGAGTQNRQPRTAIADSSALPSANRLKARVGQAGGLVDKKLGSRSPSMAPAVTPGTLLQTSTFKTPYAPEFLTNAVAGLNETTSYTAMMHDEWRNRLLSESSDRPDLIPALTAASVQSGAHFSWGGGGSGRSSAPVQRQPSYWEQKLAMEDLKDARERMSWASKESTELGTGLGTFMSPTDVSKAQDRYKQDYLAAQQSSNMAAKVLGMQPTGQTLSQWNTANRWNDSKSTPSGWW